MINYPQPSATLGSSVFLATNAHPITTLAAIAITISREYALGFHREEQMNMGLLGKKLCTRPLYLATSLNLRQN
jgi:hypothetical protein